MDTKDNIYFIERPHYSKGNTNIIALNNSDDIIKLNKLNESNEINSDGEIIYVRCKFDCKIQFPKATQVIRFCEEYDYSITDLIFDLIEDLPNLKELFFQYSSTCPDTYELKQIIDIKPIKLYFNVCGNILKQIPMMQYNYISVCMGNYADELAYLSVDNNSYQLCIFLNTFVKCSRAIKIPKTMYLFNDDDIIDRTLEFWLRVLEDYNVVKMDLSSINSDNYRISHRLGDHGKNNNHNKKLKHFSLIDFI